jgi:uncharacterized membrane protein YphA (DoxX/SURF4 family)
MMTPIFPAGTAGVGLLLLRVSVTISLLALTSAETTAVDWRHLLAILAAIALCVGVQTRVAAGISLLACLYAIGAGISLALNAVHLATAVALCLIGPGAFSVDARIFGRRQIRLGQRRPPTG